MFFFFKSMSYWPETLSTVCLSLTSRPAVCAQCLGDQSAALVGQMCFKDGQAKNTWVASKQRLLNSSSSLEDEALRSPASFSLASQLRDGMFPPAQHWQQGTLLSPPRCPLVVGVLPPHLAQLSSLNDMLKLMTNAQNINIISILFQYSMLLHSAVKIPMQCATPLFNTTITRGKTDQPNTTTR